MIKTILNMLFGNLDRKESKRMDHLGSYKIWFKNSRHYKDSFDEIWNKNHTWLFWFVTRSQSECVNTQNKARTFLLLKAKDEPERFDPKFIKLLTAMKPKQVKA